jgi:hypothetical protein
MRRLESLEPGAELRKLAGRQFSYGFFDFFKCRHGWDTITSEPARHWGRCIRRFDQRIERDAKTGRLDRLADQALADYRAGRAREL